MKGLLLAAAFSVLVAAGAILPGDVASSSVNIAAPTPSPAVENLETVREYLLSSAASDFHTHQPPMPVRFRKVRLGHIGDTTRSGSYRLCGQFSTSEKGDKKSDWTDFATIKTSGYEQYIGTTNYCTGPKIIWDTRDDLAPTLKSRLNALKKAN